MVSTCSYFQSTHPDVLCPSQGLRRTALNREHLLSKRCWSQPLLQGCIFYRLLWELQDTGNAHSKHAQGKGGQRKQSPMTWWEGDGKELG